MSFSINENSSPSKSFLKLEIYQSQICQNIKVPLPYGLSILFDNFPEKNIEPITTEKELFKYPENQFIYYLNNNNLSKNEIFEKEFIINSYTTSIFILKKNFASVKIPILYSNKNNEKQWFYLKDINNNICIKILISIEIYFAQKMINNFNNSFNILKQNSETIKENKTNKKNSNYINAINHQNKKNKKENKINNHNTYILSTNYNSTSGNSLLNITNNIYMKTINNNSNNINNLNITFPFNFSPISIFGKSNSFFIDTIKEKDDDSNHVNRNSLKSLNVNNNKNGENELKLISENDCDSITIKDNDFCSDEPSNNQIISGINNNDNLIDKDNLIENINKLISKKNDDIFNKQKIYSSNYNNYLNDKKNISKNFKILEKENEKIKNSIKIIEKSKQIYETKIINLNENLINFSKDIYRKNILNELDDYENRVILNLNDIFLYSHSLENIPNQEKGNINSIKNIINNKNEMNIKTKIPDISRLLNKKKLDYKNRKIEKEIDSYREIHNKFSPNNFKLKENKSKLNLSFSNSEKIYDENNINRKMDTNNQKLKNYSNRNKIKDNIYKNNENKKYNNIFRDYYYDTKEKKEYKKKPSKSNLIKGKLKLKIPFIENSVNNIEAKYLLPKNKNNNNYNQESLRVKTNTINTSNNNISNNSINLNLNNKKSKKLSNLNTKKIKSDKYLFKSKYNNNYKKSNTSIDKKLNSIENKILNSTINSKIRTEKNNNLYKKKLNKKENNNDKKSFNNETFRYLNNYNNLYFKGKPIIISNNNNSLGNERFLSKMYNITEIELNKKTIDNITNNKIIRRKIKNKTVKINLNLNINESYKKKTKFRNSLNMPKDVFVLNIEKKQKSRDNKNKNSSKNITLTHTYSKPIGISINYNYNTINNKNIIKNRDNKTKITI